MGAQRRPARLAASKAQPLPLLGQWVNKACCQGQLEVGTKLSGSTQAEPRLAMFGRDVHNTSAQCRASVRQASRGSRHEVHLKLSPSRQPGTGYGAPMTGASSADGGQNELVKVMQAT